MAVLPLYQEARVKALRLFLLTILVFPAICPAASKEMLELQRDVADLQDQVRKLRTAFDEKTTTLTVLVQQAVDASNKANVAIAGIQGGIEQQLRQQGKDVVGPVAGVGAKVDQMTTQFQEVANAMSDVTTRLGKLEQQMVDLGNAVRTIQTPAAPPPVASGPSTGATATSSGPPPIPGDVLYQNAYRDKLGGKIDLALQEFNDYLKYYGESSLAPAAQFWIGDIYLSQNDAEKALQAFDLVLEKYPSNNKTPDALYMKGKTLLKLDRRTAGANEFRELIRRYPGSDLATKAKAQLRSLGLSSASSASRRK
jgi:tol-pal system protein YbgF